MVTASAFFSSLVSNLCGGFTFRLKGELLTAASFWHVLTSVSLHLGRFHRYLHSRELLLGISASAAVVAHPAVWSLKYPLHLCFVWILQFILALLYSTAVVTHPEICSLKYPLHLCFVWILSFTSL